MLCYIVDGRDKPVVDGHSQYDKLHVHFTYRQG